jgi:ABC-type nickel/cobalt efflux system permease component RcnA
MAAVGSSLSLTVDGVPMPVTVTGSSYPDPALLAAGGGTVTIQATAPLPAGGRQIELRDAYDSGQPTTVQMSVTLTPGTPAPGEVSHADSGRTLGVALSPDPTGPAPAHAAEPSLRDRAFAALREPRPWALLTLVGICALLGALHALTPGHGKTVLAAYLIGTRGRPRHAVALGGVVTVTHTSSVLFLGVSVLLAGHFMLPGVLVPALELTAGAVVLALGVRIVHRRWSARHRQHHHEHPQPHGWRDLAAMGFSGGLVPCPEALSILILAVGLHRTALGLAMIVAFSAGLAAVLVGFGLVLVTARDAFAGLRPARHSVLLHQLPVVSAAVVVLLGLAMTVSGMVSVVDAAGS